MQTTKLIVARHGNTVNKGDVVLRVGSRTNLPLTEEGHEQGRRLGAKLREMNLYPTRFYAAPLRRAVETSLEIASQFELGAPPQIADFLTELDYGEDDGRPDKEVVKRLGALEANSSDLSPEELETLGREALRRWDAERILPVGWRFLQDRVNKLEDDWRAFGRMIAKKYPAETIVATTSNGIARFSLGLLPPSEKRPDDTKLSTGAFGVFELEAGFWKLKNWNAK